MDQYASFSPKDENNIEDTRWRKWLAVCCSCNKRTFIAIKCPEGIPGLIECECSGLIEVLQECAVSESESVEFSKKAEDI